jgi:pantetheine-phosphate adenylyltransferase
VDKDGRVAKTFAVAVCEQVVAEAEDEMTMAAERTGVYPGTFDPITSGHMEVVRRLAAARRQAGDRGRTINMGKGPLFSLEERIEIINDDIADFPQADRDRIEVRAVRGPADSLRVG